MNLEIKVICLTAFIITSYMTFILVLINFGCTDDFVYIWIKSWFTAFSIALPSFLWIAPALKKIIISKVENKKANRK